MSASRPAGDGRAWWPKGDPDHDRICARIRRRIAALPAGSVVLAADETHLDLLTKVRACSIPNGLRYLIPTPGSNKRRTVFGAVNVVTGQWHYHLAVQGVSIVFCYFLDLLARAYPDAPVIAVICDNGSIHHSKITTKWQAAHPRVQLIANTAPTMADRVRQGAFDATVWLR